VIVALVSLASRSSQAQEKTKLPDGIRGEMLMNAGGVESKVLGLVDAMPQDKFTWRPEEGVRSVSEVFLHIAGSNYMFPAFAGGSKAPDGLDLRKLEDSTTDKATIADIVKKSFASFKENLTNLSDADLNKTGKIFGMEMTYRAIYLLALTHMHEHLGQSIAYARTNHVVPPWTAAQQAKMKSQGMKKSN
jgi:uncharacterized damage-inducible protein DinB